MQRESKHRILPDFKSGSMKSRQAETSLSECTRTLDNSPVCLFQCMAEEPKCKGVSGAKMGKLDWKATGARLLAGFSRLCGWARLWLPGKWGAGSDTRRQSLRVELRGTGHPRPHMQLTNERAQETDHDNTNGRWNPWLRWRSEENVVLCPWEGNSCLNSPRPEFSSLTWTSAQLVSSKCH